MATVAQSRITTVRIFAAHPIAAERYARWLSAEADLRVVPDDQDADVNVYDGMTEGLDRLLSTARLRSPSVRLLLISSFSHPDQFIRLAMQGLHGAVAYNQCETDLARAVRYVALGQLWLPREAVLHLLLLDYERTTMSRGSLSRREREVAGLVARRLSNKEIAAILKITERTVKAHVAAIFEKRRISSRIELIGS